MDEKRAMLRHTLATIAYRSSRYLNGVPPEFHGFRACESSRTVLEILNHINGLLMYAHSHLAPYDSTHPPLGTWQKELDRFREMLPKLDASLASGQPLLGITEERLLQGPLADVLTHIGQIGMLRQMAGYPAEDENYIQSPITAGNLVLPGW